MRTKIIAGNWKMYKDAAEAETMVTELESQLTQKNITSQIYIASPYPFLDRLISRFRNTQIKFGAQNLSEHDEGAYTGEVSAKMLYSLGCHFAIVGHSERRQYYGETDFIIHYKILAALRYNLQPVFCCGEKLDDRNVNNHFMIVKKQISEALYGLSADSIRNVTIAYEPVWAIGTGVNATPEQAQEIHAYIRKLINENFGAECSDHIRILYGGSLKPENAQILFAQPDIDGGLIGGASLKAADFMKIIEAV
jgi:triosephosphate isomerase